MKLLKQLCNIHAPSGNEGAMTEFILDYVSKNQQNWKVQPVVHAGGLLRDAVVLQFGEPRTAIFAHLDNIGFTVRYGNELIKVGGPKTETGTKLRGFDSKGEVFCTLECDEDKNLTYKADREIDRGTDLSFVCDFREDDEYVQSCYMDNRLGVWNALQVAENLENGLIVFSCYEEVGGGSAAHLGRFIFEKFDVAQALICDITWITEGVTHGKGVAISMRDSGIPRRSYVNRIMAIAKESKIPFQLEVEGSGGSDGNVLQRSTYPFDWCFVGAPEDFVHSPNEKVHKKDIEAMTKMYQVLMEKL